jgi:hypothetical protein
VNLVKAKGTRGFYSTTCFAAKTWSPPATFDRPKLRETRTTTTVLLGRGGAGSSFSFFPFFFTASSRSPAAQ